MGLSLISMNWHGFRQEDHQGTLVQKVKSGSESSGASCSLDQILKMGSSKKKKGF